MGSLKFKAWLLLCVVMLPVGCTRMSDFDGTYGGRVVDLETVRLGFAESAEATLQMEFVDDSRATGRLSTSDGIFQDAELKPIEKLQNDALWTLRFDGDGFVNYLFMVEVSSGENRGQDALAVISLHKDAKVDLRVILGANKLYGVFHLSEVD